MQTKRYLGKLTIEQESLIVLPVVLEPAIPRLNSELVPQVHALRTGKGKICHKFGII